MTIVQFAMYGIAAGWQNFGLQSADEIALLAQAGLGDEPQRQAAIQKIHSAFPDLSGLPTEEQAVVLGQVVSAQIMLSTPSVFLGTLMVCLTISTIICVAGTFHAHRLHVQGFSLPNRVVRYVEVLVLLMAAIVPALISIFAMAGMITANGRSVPLSWLMWLPFLLLVAAAIPGITLQRWFIRWPAIGLAIAAIAYCLNR